MCERKEEDGGEGSENKGGEEVCEGSETGTSRCSDSVGGCVGEDIEMARDLEDGANTVEFPVADNVLCASIASKLEDVGVVAGGELLLV